MKYYLVFQFFLLLSFRALANPTFAINEVPINSGGEDGGTASVTAKGIYTNGEVTLDVTKDADGAYWNP